jgi:hypothetical protein
MKMLVKLWGTLPFVWKVAILIALFVIFIFGPLDFIIRKFFPNIAAKRFGPEFNGLSKSGRLLFNAILYGIMALGGGLSLAWPLLKGTVPSKGATLGISCIVTLFLIMAICEYLEWHRTKAKDNQFSNTNSKSSNKKL